MPHMTTELTTRRRARLALRILVPIAWLLVAVAMPMCAAASNDTDQGEVPDGRETISRAGVAMSFPSSERRLAEHVLEVVLEERDDLEARFPRADLSRIRVDVAGSAEEFAALSYGGVPDWGAGCAIDAERRIVVRSPKAARAPLGLRTLLRHELGHLAIHDELGDVRAPRWFHEGAASAVAGEWRLEESAALAVGAWRGTLLPLSELERGFPANARLARLAYAESYQAVLLMTELSGSDGVEELIGAVGAEPSFEWAMRRLVSADVSSFDALLLHRLRERFGLALLMRRGNLLFVGAGLLVLVGALLKWRRSRRRLAEWAREEGESRNRGGGAGGSWR